MKARIATNDFVPLQGCSHCEGRGYHLRAQDEAPIGATDFDVLQDVDRLELPADQWARWCVPHKAQMRFSFFECAPAEKEAA